MLTVLMATHDGAETLPEVLEGYRRVHAPEGGWRLVIADDGSRDATAEIAAAAGADLPLVLLRGPHRGQNATRNAALAHVEGDLVVLTDDDAVPEPDCLVRLREAADRSPDATIFAGTVRPRWRVPPPPWVVEWVKLPITYALREFATDGPIAPEEALGPCVAVRARALLEEVRFDESIGPDGSEDYAMGSETALLLQLAARGHRAVAVRDAVVEHVVLPHQTTEAWILGRAERYGRGRVHLDAIAGPRRPRERGHRRQVWKHRLALGLSYVTGDLRRRFRARWRLRFLAGRARERAAVGRCRAPIDGCRP
jgi:cellulose synthase/poly-beta-1,6-N-acetylglucosamine synthase-like glycosyltransferase